SVLRADGAVGNIWADRASQHLRLAGASPGRAKLRGTRSDRAANGSGRARHWGTHRNAASTTCVRPRWQPRVGGLDGNHALAFVEPDLVDVVVPAAAIQQPDRPRVLGDVEHPGTLGADDRGLVAPSLLSVPVNGMDQASALVVGVAGDGALAGITLDRYHPSEVVEVVAQRSTSRP